MLKKHSAFSAATEIANIGSEQLDFYMGANADEDICYTAQKIEFHDTPVLMIGGYMQRTICIDLNEAASNVEDIVPMIEKYLECEGFSDEVYIEDEQYQCQSCGKFITEDEGVTCEDGSWVCDEDTCRTLDEDNEAHIIERK